MRLVSTLLSVGLATTLLSSILLVDALSCNCNNGKVIKSEPRCTCECLEGFQLPDCDYTVSEIVRLDVYVNMPGSEFSSGSLTTAIETGTRLDSGTVQFLYAVPLDNFNKTNLLLKMPGYGVRRFLPAIEAREVWVQRQKIESAYIIPLPEPRSNPANNLPVFNYNSYTITVDSLLWLIAAFILVFWGIVLESCCCFKNDEDYIGEVGYAPDENGPSPGAKYEGRRLDGKEEP